MEPLHIGDLDFLPLLEKCLILTNSPLASNFQEEEENQDPRTWECKMCMIKNIPEKKKCVACGLLRDIEDHKPGLNFGFGENSNNTSRQWMCFTCKKINTTSTSRCVGCEASMNMSESPGHTYKMQPNEWECSVCKAHNVLSKCVICKTPSKIPIINTPIDNASKILSSKWKCNYCLLMNDNNKTECVACKRPKQYSGVEKMSNPGEWQCSICLMHNPNSKPNCIYCEHYIPGLFGPTKEEATYNQNNGFRFVIKPDLADSYKPI